MTVSYHHHQDFVWAGSTKTCTLFRGGTSRTGMLEAIDHIFVHEGVAEVRVNNVVFSARLGHPVSQHNAKIVQAMRALQLGSVQKCGCTEDTMFVHSLVLQVRSTHAHNLLFTVGV
jgi:hypothetical protein